ncbi:MAG: NAD(+)/NADH kinase [Actinobacteria bacterium]|nr:NAD(+)/NADH kinase [Actinomycetota bacterium]MBV9253832.1 NAD(+)/NADH kinase [Actinomycetota bacterium]MBV9664032.1 NAD(+)/NADH kinase [Actinomycetota bacterium]MBV9932699.1 NAD(+)/NADH kinase [Actinomycetota bacterium]
MAAVGLVCHGLRAEALDLACAAGAWLTERGHQPRVLKDDARAAGLEPWVHPADDFARGLDLAVSLGGDGTMLRTVDLVCDADVPVLGVNVGHLGYLTEVEPAELFDALERFFAGDYAVEARMTLEVGVDVGGTSSTYTALNEAVVGVSSPGHTVRLAMSLNNQAFTSYAADGVIVATPTGSTAYNLSARGPIVSPRHRAIVITPVSAHMLFDRALVLDADEVLRLEVIGDRSAALVVDGRPIANLDPGDVLRCCAGSHDALLVTFGQRDFHRILKAKFGLTDR